MICAKISQIQTIIRKSAGFELRVSKKVVSVQINIRLFLLYEPIDGDKSEPIDCQFFDVSHLLSLPVDFVESHRLSIIFCFVNGISVSQFQSDIKLTVLAVDGVIVVVAADVADTLQ